jgi:hypothetical protein
LNANGTNGASASEGATRIAKAMLYKRSGAAAGKSAAKKGVATAGSNGSVSSQGSGGVPSQESGSDAEKKGLKAEAGKKVPSGHLPILCDVLV